MAKKDQPPIMDEWGSIDFTRVTTVPDAEELVDMAFRRGRKSNAPKGAPGERGKNRELARVGAAARTIESRLHRVVREFPNLDAMHPFYRELVDVIVGLDDLRQSLGAVEWARKQVQRIRSEADKRVRRTESNHEAMQARKEAYGRMASVTNQVAEDLERLESARYELAGLPTLQMERPVLVVAGYPNVGKSSFLEKVTRATPEVAPYPFTTKGVSLGHREHGYHMVQLMDTPGLLDRPLEERNDIERQAIFAIQHAADAILFMLDPSGHCGYPIEDQLHLLGEVEREFAPTPVVVCENKADVMSTGERPAMSCTTGDGVEEVVDLAIEAALEGYRERVSELPGLDVESASEETESFSW